MSIIVNISKVRNYEELQESEGQDENGEQLYRFKPVTGVFAWFAMALGLREVSLANIDEWIFRLGVMDRCQDYLMRLPDGSGRNLTPDEVRRHVGLTTNVTPETRAVWLKRVVIPHLVDAGDKAVREAKNKHSAEA